MSITLGDNLHFTMLLLKLFLKNTKCSYLLKFTFHYASIKTSVKGVVMKYFFAYLHFTMLLLKHHKRVCGPSTKGYLHFTMLLLKQGGIVTKPTLAMIFTFHYASIKTRSFVLLLYQYLEIAFLSISFLFVFVVMLFTLNIFHEPH